MNNELKQKLLTILADGDLNTLNVLINDVELFTMPMDDEGAKRCFIHHAAAKGCLDIINVILKTYPLLVNQTDEFNQTPLIWAASRGHKEIVQYLILKNANLHQTDTHGNTPLHWAAEQGHAEVVALLLDVGAIYTPLTDAQRDLIHIAAMNGCVDVVKCLLNRDSGLLNKPDAHGETALLWAAANGHKEVVQELLRRGADIQLATNRPGHKDHGKTPLQWAVRYNHADVVALLLDAGAIYTPLTDMQFELIHIAAMAGCVEVVKRLLDRNSLLLNEMDKYGQTPLLVAAVGGRKGVVEELLRRGANTQLTKVCPGNKHHGKTPLQRAAETGHADIVVLLLDAGPSYTPHNDARYHLIHIAAMKGRVEVVKHLLDRDPLILDTTDAYGQTALLLAAKNGHQDVVQELLRRGADTQLATKRSGHNDHGKTPLQWARELGHSAIVDSLENVAKKNNNQSASTISIFAKKAVAQPKCMPLTEADRTWAHEF